MGLDFNDWARDKTGAEVRAAIDGLSKFGGNGAGRFSHSVDTFIAEALAPDYLIDPIVARGTVYACTAETNHGKTAVWTTMTCCVAAGRPIGPLGVAQASVLYLCGENPWDFRLRLRLTLSELQIPVTEIADRFRIIDSAFPLTEKIPEVFDVVKAMGGVGLVIVDTAPAYFSYAEENSNVDNRKHAMDLRALTGAEGRPAVIALCHPVKNAGRENLVPRGGGAFLNEIDANLTVWKDDQTATLHWYRKLRGQDFDPVEFALVQADVAGVVDRLGRPARSVWARPITAAEAEHNQNTARCDEDRLLLQMDLRPGGSLREWANACGWIVAEGKNAGKPLVNKVQRMLDRLQREKLVTQRRGTWWLTQAGKNETKTPK